ncbi:YdcF family protein [Wukongibacter baidiensis]|uniref:YdcF family protein n=1 Tax=Wukongibacter baidiensis TaxID=1723361 RepID=UPI003D7FC88B
MLKKSKKYRKIFIIACIFACFIVYTASSIYLYGEKSSLIKADAAVVLGAAIWGDEPSPVFRERINHGIWLYKKGYVKKIIFTGGKSDGEEMAESMVAKKYAKKKLVPSNDILIETSSNITQQNLYYAKQVGDSNNIGTFIIVSDPLHMKRAMLMAEDYGLQAYPSPTPTTLYRSWKSKSVFLAREVYYYIGYGVYRIFKRGISE